jgi:repressor of nif and glnA expression
MIMLGSIVVVKKMRPSVKWMVLLDDRILELLHEEGPHSAAEIGSDERIPYGEQHIRNRCKKLLEKGLLKKAGHGTFFISEEGVRYLNGEMRSEELEESNGNEGSSKA